MSDNIFDIVYTQLEEDFKKLTDFWLVEIQPNDDSGDIIENIKTEKQIEEKAFQKFWTNLLSDLEKSKVSTKKISEIYETVSRLYKFQGKDSKVSNKTTLFTLMNEKDFKEIIKDSMGYADVDSAWEGFWNKDISDIDRLSILSNAGFHHTKETVWAYFDPYEGDIGSENDPLLDKDAEECCTMLGLPVEWYNYRFGEHLWKIKIQPSANKFIPTVTDAGWNRWFQTIDEDKTISKWGWTRPLGAERGKKGMPEIIFRGWVPGYEKGAFIGMPDDIGLRISKS